ncbi:hypothetical protein F4814DRAFT_448972 [Daldinia grandis]|nr:hypothetical protein F4814DRAFT_448972 [Daldinia grandis]
MKYRRKMADWDHAAASLPRAPISSDVRDKMTNPTKARLRDILPHLTAGDALTFYTHVAEDVDWTVMEMTAYGDMQER